MASTTKIQPGQKVASKIDQASIDAAKALTGARTRMPTRQEIEQVTQRNATGEESIIGVMRAQRLIRSGQLPQ